MKRLLLFFLPLLAIAQVDFVQQVKNTPFSDVRKFQFAPQQPGGTLAAGNNTITLTPVPLGVNGSDANHKLYVSGGTGTAEACLINGGSGTSGSTTGTIQINCANTHSGAWSIQSATAGIQEALQYAGSGSNVQIILPTGDLTVYAPVNLPISGASGHFGNVTISGQGVSVTQVRRAASFTSGDVFSFDQNRGTAAFTLTGMDINSQAANITSGAGVHIANNSAQTIVLRDLKILDGYQGVFIDHAGSVTIENVNVVNEATYNSLGGTQANGGFIFTGVGSGNYITDSIANTNDTNTSRTWIYGLYVGGCDGLQVSNSQFVATIGLEFDPTTNQVTNFYGTNLILDSSSIKGIEFKGPGMSVAAGNINLTSPQIVSYAKTGSIPTALYGVDFPNGVNGWAMINISNPIIAGWKNDALRFLGSAKAGPITITGGSITDIGTSAAHGVGIGFQNGVGGIHITGMDIGGISSGSSQYMDYAFQGDTANNAIYPDWSIIGNNVRLHAQSSWINFPGTNPSFTNSTILGNIGATDLSNNLNFIATENGVGNAIAGTLTGVTLTKGLCVSVSLSHGLQAGANTFNLNGGGAVAIKSHLNQTNNIATAYTGSLGTILLCYDGSVWEDMSQ